jgi:heme/copper-type cytochrome/quinol oxidase subunit 3
MNERLLDVSALELETTDSRALLWWGNLGMMVIEGTMFAMLIATYLYLRVANLDWPPSTVPNPDLTLPTVNLLIMIVSCVPMIIADRAATRGNAAAVRICYALCVLAGIAVLVIRSIVVANLGFKWSDHAYGSVVWVSIGMHTFHTLAATGETLLLLVYSLVKPVVKKTLLDFRCTAVYWYFIVIMWLPFYFIIYVAPLLSRKERF